MVFLLWSGCGILNEIFSFLCICLSVRLSFCRFVSILIYFCHSCFFYVCCWFTTPLPWCHSPPTHFTDEENEDSRLCVKSYGFSLEKKIFFCFFSVLHLQAAIEIHHCKTNKEKQQNDKTKWNGDGLLSQLLAFFLPINSQRNDEFLIFFSFFLAFTVFWCGFECGFGFRFVFFFLLLILLLTVAIFLRFNYNFVDNRIVFLLSSVFNSCFLFLIFCIFFFASPIVLLGFGCIVRLISPLRGCLAW